VPLAADGSVLSLVAHCCKHITRLSTIHDHALRYLDMATKPTKAYKLFWVSCIIL